MATHSSILAWRIPWAEEPGGLQFMGSQRVGHDWATSLLHFTSSTPGLAGWDLRGRQYTHSKCQLPGGRRGQPPPCRLTHRERGVQFWSLHLQTPLQSFYSNSDDYRKPRSSLHSHSRALFFLPLYYTAHGSVRTSVFSLSHVVNIFLSLKVDQNVSFFSTKKNYFHLSTPFPSTGYSKINGVNILYIIEKYI